MSRARLLLLVLSLTPLGARQDYGICGTHPGGWQEELHLHRRAVPRRLSARAAIPREPAAQDIGNIAILEDSGGVVARRNSFNLDQRTLQFFPVAGSPPRYYFQVANGSYDDAAASAGKPLDPLGDDDSTLLSLQFSFPYYGNSYQQVYLNSDGNLTFLLGDAASTERSLGRFSAGQPRIAGLFTDLDPSRMPGSVHVLSQPDRWVASWIGVPEYAALGAGPAQTFQIRLYPDGRIEFAYAGVNPSGAVVGISPGGLLGPTSLVSFGSGSLNQFSFGVAERFGGVEEIDTATAAQQFYQTHEDAYDYLVIFNDLAIPARAGAVAWESTVRNNRSGYGDTQLDVGSQFGSASRLQAVMNMGPLNQYPVDPNGFVPARAVTHDTPLTILTHEAGHLFLAYASVPDPLDSSATPMLGSQKAHWAFTFNSEASVLEGNRIRDDGAGASPRFTTTGTVEGYAPLDQYLMGLRAPEEVPPTFLVTGAGPAFTLRLPQPGVSFNGDRRDVSVQDIIAVEGRRTPDYTVAQHHFRFAFLLVVAEGTTPSQAELDQLDTYRRLFEAFYLKASSGRATADTALRLALRLSTFPAAGVLVGRSAPATVSTQKTVAAPLTILLKTQTGVASLPASVTIPAGAASATFNITGVRPGVEEISAEPSDSRYDTGYSRVPVLAGTDALQQLAVVSGDQQQATPGAALHDPIVLRVRDINNVGYAGIRVQASVAGGGAVDPAVATSGADGIVKFLWTAGQSGAQLLTASLEGSASASVSVSASGLRRVRAIVNAASFSSALAPGSLATIFGDNLSAGASGSAVFPWPPSLAGVQVTIRNLHAPILFVSDTQVNILIPPELEPGPAEATISVNGASTTLDLPPIQPLAPGIFFDAASGFGAILNAGTARSTVQQPAAQGDFVEIYATGLGALLGADAQGLQQTASRPQVLIGGVPAAVIYSGLAPGYLGLYQIDAQIPAGALPGAQTLSVTMNGVPSNMVKIGIR